LRHTLHYITLHYITLHYITLHYITLHYITLHYMLHSKEEWEPQSGANERLIGGRHSLLSRLLGEPSEMTQRAVCALVAVLHWLMLVWQDSLLTCFLG
jgi:hypothetical protein